jgi:hypothetical protein
MRGKKTLSCIGVNMVHTGKKNTEASLASNKEVGLELIAEQAMYIFMSCEQIAGQNDKDSH